MGKNNLIIGVDPGTTLGYSIIDLDGNLIELNSSKLLNIADLTLNLIKFGRVAVISTDKANIPSYIKSLARRNGAIIISPEKDMLIEEKRDLIKNFKVTNTHERDALASAFFAYNKLNTLIDKIKRHLKDKEYLFNDVFYLVVKNQISVSEALKQLQPQEIVEEKQKVIQKQEIKQISTEEILIENKILNYKNKFYKQKINHLNNKIIDLNKKLNSEFLNKRTKQVIEYKNDRIESLINELSNYQLEINSLKNEIVSLKQLINNSNDKYLVKKLTTLSKEEVINKLKPLNLENENILFIKDPSIVSDKSLSLLKNIRFILTKKDIKSSKLEIINIKDSLTLETQDYLLIDKDIIKQKIDSKQMFKKILSEYKEERKSSLFNNHKLP